MAVTRMAGSDDLAWQLDGLCYGQVHDGEDDLDPWFPHEPVLDTNRKIPQYVKDMEPVVRELCAGCPVLDTCKDYAVVRPELRGVWGGTLTHQREQERRRESRRRSYYTRRGEECPPRGTAKLGPRFRQSA